METRAKKRKVVKFDSDDEPDKNTSGTQTDLPDSESDDPDYDDDADDEEDYDHDPDQEEYDSEEDSLQFLKKKNPEYYRRFMEARAIMKSREVTIFDILACDIVDEKRATLLEKYEVLKNIEPHTEEYFEHRDRLRVLYYKYLAEIPPPIPFAAYPTLNPSSNSKNSKDINNNNKHDNKDKKGPASPNPFCLSPQLPKKMTDAETELSNLKDKIKKMVCSSSNRKVFEEKLDEFDDNIRGDEKSKIKRWLNMALTLPLDRISSSSSVSSVSSSSSSSSSSFSFSSPSSSSIIQETQAYLDKRLYGMKNVKERLLLFLNKKLREGNSRGCNIALIGKPGVGKCLHPDTEIRMYDLSVKKAKDIVVGDLLLGDDHNPRAVLSITTGKEEMFSVRQQYGETYIVNRSHILSLRNRNTGAIVDVPIVDVLNSQEKYTPYSASYYSNGNDLNNLNTKKYGYFYSSPFNRSNPAIHPSHYHHLPSGYLEWSRADKMNFYEGLVCGSEILYHDDDGVRIHIPKHRPTDQIVNLIRSMGWRCVYDDNSFLLHIHFPEKTNSNGNVDRSEKIDIWSMGEGDYCGFEIDGNRRFVLADWTVTHNTAISKALSECLKLPFAQVSFGGVTNAEFLMGHDYTYVGSRPGEITRCLIRMGSKNGILFFDEFDKATDKKDIMSTLLHITDFSQNNEFRDNYFPEIAQDLSKIWFIYSMNELPTDPAMLDRLEIIRVDEYTSDERKLIAKNHLFPKYVSELKIENDMIITDSGLKSIIDLSSGSQHKKGVRDLERCINLIVEKVYFFLCNRDSDYDYPWFKTIKDCVNEDGKVVIKDRLIEKILEDSKKDPAHLSMYL